MGLSGGVDSAVSALLLQQQGYEVDGLFMKNWEEDDSGGCGAEEDLKYARQVADTLGITLHTANFSDQYWNDVFTHFLEGYRCGQTPNPDVYCNREIKFRVFLEHAKRIGAEKIATGHYVGSEHKDGCWRLLRGSDTNKDQSYFLHLIEQEGLCHTLFPLAEMSKPQVRELAKQHGFDCHARKDSTGICFIGSRRFRDFLARYLPPKQGDILDEHGKVIGQHEGCWYYTIGQRQGLGIGGVSEHRELPWYVARKDIEHNTLTVVQSNDHPLLFSESLLADNLHWIAHAPEDGEQLDCKIRYRQPDQRCTLKYSGERQAQVCFDQPQRSVTPGQAVVFYRGRECLGGGIISTSA